MQAFKETVSYALAKAKAGGATDCEVMLTRIEGLDVMVRNQDVETVEFTGEKAIAISVYRDKKKATVGISDPSHDAIDTAVARALDMADALEEDPFEGLPAPSELAQHYKELSLDHPWDITPAAAIELGIALEKAALSQHEKIKQSEGVHVSTQRAIQTFGNSLGFFEGEARTRHSLSCVLIAEKDGKMQRDYAYDTRRDYRDLLPTVEIAAQAAKRTVARLDSRPIATTRAPVLFDPPIASGIIHHLLSAISGGSLYREASFLCGALGDTLFPSFVNIEDNPFILKGIASCNADNEGVQTVHRHLIKNGVLEGYLLNTYTARRLKMATTGNAGGAHNIIVTPGDKNLAALLKQMGRGLYVTELMGQGVNIVTGDYSRGAAGFWVENGEIQFPVESVTIAGNLKDMFKNIVAVGNDVDTRGQVQIGSLLMGEMTIAGS
jgi:PmbA protein